MSKNLSAVQLDQLQVVRSQSRLTQQPASAVEAGTPLYDDDAYFNHSNLILLASAVRAATQIGQDRTNNNCAGLILIADVTVAPGVDTVTPIIEGKDPASGKYYTILQGAAIAAVSTVVLRVYPGLVAAANLVANDVLPRTWRFRMVHSAATNFTYSVGGILLSQ